MQAALDWLEMSLQMAAASGQQALALQRSRRIV